MKAKVKNTGEIFRVLYLDSEVVLIKCRNEVKPFRIHEVDLIPESAEDYQKREINWEQRRYELAKEAMNGILSVKVNQSLNDIAILSVGLADRIIEELQKE